MSSIADVMFQLNFINHTLGRERDQWDTVRIVFETFIPVSILVIGLVGNVLLCATMIYLRTKRNPSFYLLCILGVTDTITLVVNFVYYYIFPWLIVKPRFMMDELWCKIMGMFAYSTLGCSSWILVTIVTSRFVAIHWPLHKLRVAHTRIVVAVVYILGNLMHIPIGFLMHHDDRIGICILKDNIYARIAANTHLGLFILVPFIILFVLNSIISWDIRQKRKRDERFRGKPMEEKPKRNTTAMLVATSWCYLILTIPWYVQDVFWRYITSLDAHTYNSIRYASNSIGYTLTLLSCATNFYIYCLAFRNFRIVFMRMLCRRTSDYSPGQCSNNSSIV